MTRYPYLVLFLSVIATLTFAFVGCDDNGSDGDGDADTDVDGDSDGDSDGDADSDPVCETEPGCMASDAACMEGCGAGPYGMTCVGGTLLDENGEPLACQPAVVCANQRCFAGETDADGFFAVSMSGTPVEDVAVYFPTNPQRHTPFCLYEEACDGANHLCTEFVLYPAPISGTAVPEGELPAEIRVEADDGAALILPAGTEMRLPLGAPQWLALERFPLDEHVPCFIDPTNLPAALYVVTPLDTMVIEPGTVADPVISPASLDLPNTTGLGAGAEVQIFVIGGGHALEVGAHEGEWSSWLTATVSEDGTRIRSAVGEGLGYLTWFAVYE